MTSLPDYSTGSLAGRLVYPLAQAREFFTSSMRLPRRPLMNLLGPVPCGFRLMARLWPPSHFATTAPSTQEKRSCSR